MAVRLPSALPANMTPSPPIPSPTSTALALLDPRQATNCGQLEAFTHRLSELSSTFTSLSDLSQAFSHSYSDTNKTLFQERAAAAAALAAFEAQLAGNASLAAAALALQQAAFLNQLAGNASLAAAAQSAALDQQRLMLLGAARDQLAGNSSAAGEAFATQLAGNLSAASMAFGIRLEEVRGNASDAVEDALTRAGVDQTITFSNVASTPFVYPSADFPKPHNYTSLIIGIAGAIVGIALVLAGLVLFRRRWLRNRRQAVVVPAENGMHTTTFADPRPPKQPPKAFQLGPPPARPAPPPKTTIGKVGKVRSGVGTKDIRPAGVDDTGARHPYIPQRRSPRPPRRGRGWAWPRWTESFTWLRDMGYEELKDGDTRTSSINEIAPAAREKMGRDTAMYVSRWSSSTASLLESPKTAGGQSRGRSRNGGRGET